MPPVIRPDPYAGYSFLMTVNGVSDDGSATAASFSEITLGAVTAAVITYRNGSEPPTPRKHRGLIEYENLTCKRGITGDLNFWNWMLAGITGQVQRADGSIVLRDENQTEVMRWNFRRAWPCKFTGPGLNAANSEIAIDTMEICHEGIEIDR
jgi:phage tail-like protein